MAHTMHLFPRFPLELRQMIWRYAMLPRLVRVRPYKMEQMSSKQEKPSRSENPALLFVNHESRMEVLKRYMIISQGDARYIDFSHDIIFYEFILNEFDDTNLEFDDTNLTSHTETLAIDYRELDWNRELLVQTLCRYRKLRHVSLVVQISKYFFWRQSTGSTIFVNFEKEDHFKMVKWTIYENIEKLRKQVNAEWPIPDVYFVPCGLALENVMEAMLG